MGNVFCKILIAIVGVCFLGSCAAPTRIVAVPAGEHTKATVPGFKRVRFYPDEQLDLLYLAGLEALARERLDLSAKGHSGPLPTANFLSISGGGDNGAFTAGLLMGWTESGKRPTFKVVTGTSTGALIAPFAFLGPSYDQTLKEVYTTISAKDIFEERSLLLAIFDDAMADTTPLWRFVRRQIEVVPLCWTVWRPS